MIGDIIVAVEFQFVEGCCDAKPSGHGGGFNASDSRLTDDNHIAAAHGAADEDHFELDLSASSQFARTEEENAAGADVSGDERNRKIFGSAVDTAKPQGKP